MHRGPLRQLLRDYQTVYPAEHEIVASFTAFLDAHEDCLLRTCVPGHITASAWILDPEHEHCLLTLHRKLGKWLQLGGHVDGEPDVARAALREAQEESGMAQFDLFPGALDLDIHPIPARPGEPEHLHLDVRFLLIAGPDQDLLCSDESIDLAWVPLAELPTRTEEWSVLRLQEKAARILVDRL